MARFKVGDRARVKYTRHRETTAWRPGAEVVVVAVDSGVNPHAMHSGPDGEAVREELLRIARGLG